MEYDPSSEPEPVYCADPVPCTSRLEGCGVLLDPHATDVPGHEICPNVAWLLRERLGREWFPACWPGAEESNRDQDIKFRGISTHLNSEPAPLGEDAIAEYARVRDLERSDFPPPLLHAHPQAWAWFAVRRRRREGIVTLYGLVEHKLTVPESNWDTFGVTGWRYATPVSTIERHTRPKIGSDALVPVEHALWGWYQKFIFGKSAAGRPAGSGVTWATKEALIEDSVRVLPDAHRNWRSKRRAHGATRGLEVEVSELLHMSLSGYQKSLSKFGLTFQDVKDRAHLSTY